MGQQMIKEQLLYLRTFQLGKVAIARFLRINVLSFCRSCAVCPWGPDQGTIDLDMSKGKDPHLCISNLGFNM